jgi:hypothetical protein
MKAFRYRWNKHGKIHTYVNRNMNVDMDMNMGMGMDMGMDMDGLRHGHGHGLYLCPRPCLCPSSYSCSGLSFWSADRRLFSAQWKLCPVLVASVALSAVQWQHEKYRQGLRYKIAALPAPLCHLDWSTLVSKGRQRSFESGSALAATH